MGATILFFQASLGATLFYLYSLLGGVKAATYDHLYGIAAFKKLARKLWCRCGVVVVSVGPLWGCRWVLWGLCGAFVGRQIFLCIKFEMTFFSKKCDPKFPGR